MARTTGEGAVVSDNGWWYWTGLKWAPLGDKPAGNAPGAFSRERRELVGVVSGRTMGDLKRAGEALAAAIRPYGSLEAYEIAQGVSVRTYRSEDEYRRDAQHMAARGWRPEAPVVQQGNVAVGRTLATAVMTGGLGVALTGRSRKAGTITITWVRSPANYGLRSGDGRWWWDGQRWIPLQQATG